MLVTSFNLVYNSARSRAFKRNMLGTYGAKATGISPGTTWPTPRDIHLGEWSRPLLWPKNKRSNYFVALTKICVTRLLDPKLF